MFCTITQYLIHGVSKPLRVSENGKIIGLYIIYIIYILYIYIYSSSRNGMLVWVVADLIFKGGRLSDRKPQETLKHQNECHQGATQSKCGFGTTREPPGTPTHPGAWCISFAFGYLSEMS